MIRERAERARCEARARRPYSRTGKSALAAEGHTRGRRGSETVKRVFILSNWKAPGVAKVIRDWENDIQALLLDLDKIEKTCRDGLT